MTTPKNLVAAKDELLAHFKCQQSGVCCITEGYVYVTPENIAGMAGILGLSISEFRKRYVRKDGGWDIIASPKWRKGCFLDENNRCQVYEHRPDYCREFPRCPELWESDEAVHVELKKCAGMRRAYEAVFKQPYIPPTEASSLKPEPDPRP